MRYITDTNALLKQPSVLKEYECVIPSSVLREIEHLERTRRSDRQLQYEIRRLKRALDKDEKHVYIDLKDYKFTLEEDWDAEYVDNILIQIAVDNGYGMISNDVLVKEKCRSYNIPLLKLEQDTFVEHKGFKTIFVTDEELLDLYDNRLHINRFKDEIGEDFELLINEYLIINNDVDGELLDIMKWDGEKLIPVINKEDGSLFKEIKSFQFGLFEPKDEQQIMAVDSILENQLTSLRGRAGSGKSLIALSTAWHLVEKEGYKLVIFVNPVPVLNSQELGFYKGDRLEKLMQSSVGTMLKSKFGDEVEILRQIQDNKLDILPFVDLRGFDTGGNKTIVWIMESQNLTSELLKLGLQRISETTKVVVDGDYHLQVDKDVYAMDNGMKRMSEVFRGRKLYGEVELQNVWRSEIADIAELM